MRDSSHFDVFISYSRQDVDFVQGLKESLEKAGKTVWVDLTAIEPSEEWRERIRGGIEGSDNFLFIISQDSIKSIECQREIDYAVELRKRIVPIMFCQCSGRELPPSIRRYNWLEILSRNDIENKSDDLIRILDIDLEWVAQHTHLQMQSLEWEQSNRSKHLLLRGDPLQKAQQWFEQGPDKDPQPNPLQAQYIASSRKSAANRRRTLLAAISIALVVISILAAWAFYQRGIAERRATQSKSLALASSAQRAHVENNLDVSIALALQAHHTLPQVRAREVLEEVSYFSPGTRKRLVGHSDGVLCAAFSPDPKDLMVASGSADDTIRLWDVLEGIEIKRLEGHSDDVLSVAFDPDGRYLLSASADKTIKLWDVKNAAVLKTYAGHQDIVTAVAFSPDGRLFVSTSTDGTFRVWEVVSGLTIQSFNTQPHRLRSLAVSPDGKMAAAGSHDDLIYFWDLTKFTQMGSSIKVGSHGVVSLQFTPDSKSLLFGRGGFPNGYNAGLLDIVSKRVVKYFRGYASGNYVTISPDGLTALIGSVDNRVTLWHIEKEEIIFRFSEHLDNVTAVAFSPNGRTAISASKDGSLRLWDLHNGSELRRFQRPTGPVVAIGADNRTVLSALAGSNDLVSWNSDTGEIIRYFSGHRGSPICVDISPDGHYVLSGAWDRNLILWGMKSGKPLRTFSGHKSGVVAGAISPDGRFALSGSYYDKSLRMWDLKTGAQIHRRFSGRTLAVTSIAFSPDGKKAVVGLKDHSVRLLDVTTGKELKRFDSHQSPVSGVSYSPNGMWIASSSKDGRLLVWDIVHAKIIRRLTGHSGGHRSVVFGPLGNTLLSVAPDHSIRLWDVENGREINRFVGHVKSVRNLAFSGDGKLIISAAWDRITRVWQVEKPDDVVSWIHANRYVRELTPLEQARYGVELQ